MTVLNSPSKKIQQLNNKENKKGDNIP